MGLAPRVGKGQLGKGAVVRMEARRTVEGTTPLMAIPEKEGRLDAARFAVPQRAPPPVDSQCFNKDARGTGQGALDEPSPGAWNALESGLAEAFHTAASRIGGASA
jgi:hypothetical protein